MTPARSASPPSWQRDLVHVLVGSACGLLLGLVFHGLAPRSEPADLARFREVRSFVESTFVREVDPRRLTDDALRGMVEALDPYSRYYAREDLQAMDRETSGHYQGIGVVFARPMREAQVLFVLPGSPAAEAGIGVGDRFLEVGAEPVAELAEGELQRRIGDPANDPLELLVASRDGAERRVRVRRADLVDPTVRHADMLDAELRVGYLAVTAFTRETPNEFDAAMSELERRGVQALVIDVRGNLGGVLRSAVKLANRFLSAGLVVSQEGRGEPVLHEASPKEAWHEGLPLVVLVDGESASASEVFAAALQEHRAAVVVGSPSYGKGMVQQLKTFGDEAAVKLTTAYYYTPSHRNLERTVEQAWEAGIVPDLAVALDELEARRVHQHLTSYSPPAEALDAIRAWEAEEGRDLLTPRPPDAQLDAALALLRGERPGAYRTERTR